MVRALLVEASRQGRTVVLDTETPSNVAIYEHFGFHADDRIGDPQGDLSFTVLCWRPSTEPDSATPLVSCSVSFPG